jgi:2-C-methyl-D-erythritol 2,4-cyclodiphosphate synthase
VEIPHSHSLVAHSDGDVLLHALCDALLGAAALGDIGRHFPDSDNAFRGIDSRELLRKVVAQLDTRSLTVSNADLTLVAQEPKLAPHVDTMRDIIAQDLHVDATRINVKATTTEHLGFTGRKEGIAAFAVVLLDE